MGDSLSPDSARAPGWLRPDWIPVKPRVEM